MLATPPSTINLPSISTGFKRVGKEALARKASGKDPFSKRISFPVSISVPIQKKGIGSLEKSFIASTEDSSSVKKLRTFCPFESPKGKPILPSLIGKVIAVLPR